MNMRTRESGIFAYTLLLYSSLIPGAQLRIRGGGDRNCSMTDVLNGTFTKKKKNLNFSDF